MDNASSTAELSSLLSDGAEVSTTVYDFGKAKITRFVQAKLCLLEISGVYSSSLGKEIETLALQWRGDIGLAFKDIVVVPSAHNSTGSYLTPSHFIESATALIALSLAPKSEERHCTAIYGCLETRRKSPSLKGG